MIEVNAKDFQAALSQAARVSSRKEDIPILCNVALQVIDGRLFVTGSDLERFIRVSVPLERMDMSGGLHATVNAQILTSAVSNMPGNKEILLGHQDDILGLVCGRYSLKMRSLPIADFPFPEVIKKQKYRFKMVYDDLIELLQVAYAMSTEETRYYLNGVYLHFDKGGLLGVATNGHELAVRYSQRIGEDGKTTKKGVILPAKTVRELSRLAHGQHAIYVFGDDKLIGFEAGDVSLISRLIDYDYPNYGQVIPEANNYIMAVGKAELQRGIKACMAVPALACKLSFKKGEKVLELSMTHDGDLVTEVIDIEWNGPDLDVGFNPKYLLNALGSVKGDSVTCAFSDPSTPVLIRGEDNEPEDTNVVMPMRI